jgi:hypothetical protein
MGRPLSKDVNGVKVIGPFSSGAGIKVTGRFDGNTNDDYYIVKQRGARTYVVTRDGSQYFVGVLKESINDNGDILITGSGDGTSPGNISIAKLTKRIATDFSGNRYTWFLTQYEDSSGDVIKLTQV